MLDKLKNILNSYTEMPVEEIEPGSAIRDFGLTSFDIMNIVADCEEEFGIQIPDREIRTFQTVSDILIFLENQQNVDAGPKS